MDIYKQIDNVNTVAELSSLWTGTHKVMTELRKKIKDDEMTRSALSDVIDADSQVLADYGSIKDIKSYFYTRLGELNKDQL